MNAVYILLGGNIGDRIINLSEARRLISEEVGEIQQESSIYETAAWGYETQPDFLNQVILVITRLECVDVLSVLLNIEKKLGRTRFQKWHERTIDLDILFFNNDEINRENLVVPHPLMQERRFVLYPLSEIASNYIHPVFKITCAELLHNCQDRLEVKRVSEPIS